MNMREKSDTKVKKLIKKIGGRTTVNSGATFDDADIRLPGYLVEHKYRTGTGRFLMDIKVWNKVKKQALQRNRKPMYMFTNDENDYICLYKNDIYIMDFPGISFTMIEVESDSDKNLILDTETLSFETCDAITNKDFIIMKPDTFKKLTEVNDGRGSNETKEIETLQK